MEKSLITQTVAEVRGILVASPGLLAEMGMPSIPADLRGWPMIGVHPYFADSIAIRSHKGRASRVRGRRRFLTSNTPIQHTRREHNEDRVAATRRCSGRCGRLQSVDPGHMYVHQNQLGAPLLPNPNRPLPIGRFPHAETDRVPQLGQPLPIVLLVIDNQNARDLPSSPYTSVIP